MIKMLDCSHEIGEVELRLQNYAMNSRIFPAMGWILSLLYFFKDNLSIK